MKFAFIIDPISSLDPTHDTSVAIMEAAQALGYEIWITEIHQLTVLQGKAFSTLQSVQLKPVTLVNSIWKAQSNWYHLDQPVFSPLEDFNAVFMRKDPPVSIPYLYATYILDLINPTTTKVINSPHGLRVANEKMYALQFDSVIPDTIVTQNKSVIRDFIAEKSAGVIKPLGGKAGEGILFLEAGDRNFNSLIEISTKQGQEPVMVQTYLHEAKEGDKRIIILNGEAIGAVNRIPTGKEFRGNMAVGGRVAKTEITAREQEICRVIAPKLVEDGLFFVGIDVIGGYLTEINVTSPTGIREIDRLNHVSLANQVIKKIVNHHLNLL